MKKPIATFIGRVASDARTLTGRSGKSFIAFTLVGDEQLFGEKRYRQRTDIKLQAREMEQALADIKEGALVCVSGEVSSNVYESKREAGKWMSNVEIYTFYYSVEQHADGGGGAPARPAPVVNAGNPVRRPAATPPATPPADDDVPF